MQDSTTPLTILVVASRPRACPRLPSRQRVEALYDALEMQGQRLQAEWLWPATYEALTSRLASTERATPSALYLDGLWLAEARAIALEGEDGQPFGLAIPELAQLLCENGVPLLMLAVQSDRATDAQDLLGVAEAIAVAGVAHVVALDIAGEHAREALAAFFTGLLAGHSFDEACREAARALPNNVQAIPPLAAYHASGDASLPGVNDERATQPSKVVRFPSAGLSPAWQRLALQPAAGGLPPAPPHGFHGRAHELSLLEEALRDGPGPLLVHGYKGVGKTALVTHAARWLVRTEHLEQVVYSDFSGGGGRQSALYDLGVRLLGENFALADHEDPAATIEKALAQTPTCIIWDGLEGVLPDGEFALPTERLDELLKLGARLAGVGQTRLCVISTDPAIPDPNYSEKNLALKLELKALPDDEGAELLRSLVYSACKAILPIEQAAELTRLLGGHPLALAVAASLFAERSAAEIVHLLAEIMPDIHQGEARLRNQALDVALEALARSFEPVLKEKLPRLALFMNGLMGPMISSVTQLDSASWAKVQKRLALAGLLNEEHPAGLAVPYLRLNSAFPEHLWRGLESEVRASLEDAYCGSYMGLLGWLSQNLEAAAISHLIRLELPNLRRTLLLFERAQKLTALSDCLGYLRLALDKLGLSEERDWLAKRVTQAVAAAMPEEGPLGRPAVQFLLYQTERLLSVGRLDQGGPLVQNLVTRIIPEEGLSYGGEPAALDRGLALMLLARCMEAVGQFGDAAAKYTQAMQLFGACGDSEQARQQLLQAQQRVASMLLSGGAVDAAKASYAEALELAESLGDTHAMGMINDQLGNVAVNSGEFEEAQKHFERALEHLGQTDDLASVATTWNQLAALAWGREDYAEAERCYQLALEKARQGKFGRMEGQLLMQLARVFLEAGRKQDAIETYAQAIKLHQQEQNTTDLITAEMALASVYLEDGQLDNARVQAEAARVQAEANAAQGARPWEAHGLLMRIAELQNDAERVRHWRARAQESYAESSQAAYQLREWKPLLNAVARAALGEALESETVERLEKLEQDQTWSGLAATLWRVLSGERGADLHELLDPVDALLTRRVLEVIANPALLEEPEESSDT